MLNLPPGVSGDDYRKVPNRFREDALQEAWLAHCEGQNPLRALRGYVYRERAHERRETNFSSLDKDQREEVRAKLGT